MAEVEMALVRAMEAEERKAAGRKAMADMDPV
jgi:hypothetical protein